MARLAVKDLDGNNFTAFRTANTVRGISNVFSFLAKDRTKESFL